MVSGTGKNPWTEKNVSLETDMEEGRFSIQVGQDGDITIVIDTARECINAVIGNPANNSGDMRNSKETYRLFMDGAGGVDEKFKLRLLDVLG